MASKKSKRGEIRGLKVGDYYSPDGSALLRVSRKDDGVVIEVADFDADIYYEFVVDRDDAHFVWGSIASDQEEQIKKENGQDGTDNSTI